MKTTNTALYETMPVRRAVITLALPTILSQLVTVLYNMADTYFIGQMNDPNQVAAATLSMPPFLLLTGLANLFGIGGASMISRSLGKGDRDRARKGAAFSIWAAGATALLYGLLIFFLRPWLLPLIGADADTIDYCTRYVVWTITIGALPTVLTATFAHLVRAEGYARQASIGVGMGALLNVILDPIFIFGFSMEILGAAVATMLSNLVTMVYFIVFLVRIRQKTVISLSPSDVSLRDRIPQEILSVGFPSFLMMLLVLLSNTVLNRLMASYSNEAIAGMGIAKRIDMLAIAIANGMTQGVLSLIGYNYASGNRERMKKVIHTTFAYTLVLALAGLAFLYLCAAPVAKFFIDDAQTVEYGQYFLRAICFICPTIAVNMLIITIFQAVGFKGRPMLLTVLRKGGLDIPLMLLFNALFGIWGIGWAPFASDAMAMCVALILFLPFYKKLFGNAHAAPET